MLKDKKPIIIDVRQPTEFRGGHIPGSLMVPLNSLADCGILEWIDHDEIVVVCRSGSRSSRGKQILEALGCKNVHNLDGGLLAWKGPLTTESRERSANEWMGKEY